jgi:iron-sulfur cluster assembly protein
MTDLVLESGIKKGITFTPTALKEVKRLIAEQGIGQEQGLRLGVKGGGCAGFTYILEFDAQKEGDNVYTIDGVKVLVDFSSELYLAGTEVDFQSGLNNRGFVYNNPNATKTCGCGESFG